MDPAQSMLEEYCLFPDASTVWVITGISRPKDNAEGFHPFMMRRVVRSRKDIPQCLHDIRAAGCDPGTTYRTYVSINARNASKAAFSFLREMAAVLEGVACGRADAQELVKRLDSQWKTELQQTRNRATKRFLLDVDGDDETVLVEAKEVLSAVPTQIRATLRTPGGWAVVFDACDTRAVMDRFADQGVELKQDSMLFVEQWTGRHPLWWRDGNPEAYRA